MTPGMHPLVEVMKVGAHQTLACDMPPGTGIINCDYGATY